MPFVFSHVEYCDMHFVYGFCNGNCFPSVSVSSERQVVRTINTREEIVAMIERIPRLSTRRTASRIGGVSHMLVLRTIHEEDFYPYHDQPVQHLEPGDHAKRMDFCRWIQAHPNCWALFYSQTRRRLPGTV